MVNKPAVEEGVVKTYVRNREGRLVPLPFVFFYGRRDRVTGGNRMIKSHASRKIAEAEARKTLRRLRSQNPGITYEMDDECGSACLRAPRVHVEPG
jgi:hypothetical protein